MLIILIVVLLLASVLVLFVSKNRESIYLCLICMSLTMEFLGILIFIAKKGGYSNEILNFLFLSKQIKIKVQYMLITLGQMGYILSIGRYLYPFFLILFALQYSSIPGLRKNGKIKYAAAVLPVLSLILYYPAIYRSIVMEHPLLQGVVTDISYAWCIGYVGIALLLLWIEFFSIRMKFFRSKFGLISICMLSLSALYILYGAQDPGQVYIFYNYNFPKNYRIGYLRYAMSVNGFYILAGVNIVCSILGFYSFARYAHSCYELNREEVVLKRKFDTAKIGASMFVHGMKNQFLANNVIYKRIDQLYKEPEVDTGKVKEYVDMLNGFNHNMMAKLEELNRIVKTNSLSMVPVKVEDIFRTAREQFYQKYPLGKIEVCMEANPEILVDKTHLCEAVYNLLMNAQEAVLAAGRGEDGKIDMLCYQERMYTVIEIQDNGTGIKKGSMKKIFDPFYTEKNTNSNWGMGLYYTREIVKSHFGILRVESKEGSGSRMFILLPRYQ